MKLPKGWKTALLGSNSEVLTGFPFRSEFYSVDGASVRLLRGDNIAQGSVRWDDAECWPMDKAKGLDRYLLKLGDVVLAMDRTWVKAGLKYARLKTSDLPCLLVQRVARIRGTENLLTDFAAFLISSDRFVQHVKGVQTESAVPHISTEQIKDFPVTIPPLPEQRKIADILSTWDEALEKLDALITSKERRKKGLMQQLLTGESRLSGAKDTKRTLKASEMFANRSERNVGCLPALSVTQDQGVLLRSDLDRRIQHDANNIHTYKVACEGDFIISLRSFEGGLEYTSITGAVSPAYHVIYPIIEMDRSFYRHYFKSPDFIGRLATSVIGIRDGKQVSLEDFRFIRLPYPALNTQKEAGKVLDVCDEELRLLRAQRAAIDQQKRGLMQKLLTGKVRVRDKDTKTNTDRQRQARTYKDGKGPVVDRP